MGSIYRALEASRFVWAQQIERGRQVGLGGLSRQSAGGRSVWMGSADRAGRGRSF